MSAVTQQQQQQQLKTAPKNKAKDTAVGFVIGGLAACGAVTFTNPWEVSYDAEDWSLDEKNKGILNEVRIGSQDSSSIARWISPSRCSFWSSSPLPQ